MKIMKKILNIMLIFLVIQILGAAFISPRTYAEGDSFFEKAFSSGKKWKDMGGGNVAANLENATKTITNATDDIYNGVRVVGIGIFMINFAFLFITLNMKNNGKDIAGAKTTIVFSFALALLFIFAKTIMEFFTNIFEQFEGIM